MQTLFFEESTPQPAPATKSLDGPFAAVALEQAIDKVLDYRIPTRLRSSIEVGQRVRVPLGRKNRANHGYVIAINPTSEYPRVKDLLDISDHRILIDRKLLELARWISRYYCTPLGLVMESMIPAAVKKKTGLGYSQMVRLARPRDEVQAMLEKTKAPKRRAILARLLQLEPEQAVELNRLAGEAGTRPPTVRKLVVMGLISIRPEADLAGFAAGDAGVSDQRSGDAELELNEDQRRVQQDLMPRITEVGFNVNLLFGVTGSGKTEVYLRCIREVVQRGRQAIVLVPEIALTPQTVGRFTARFDRVAVLHSGQTATQRHRHWQQIARGQADVIIGARSAVFAPAPDAGIIVVDEEHESSYKSDTAPRYHARDVAVKRAQLENIPILLGSATPSLEMWNRVSDMADRRSEMGNGVRGSASGVERSTLVVGRSGSVEETSNVQRSTFNVQQAVSSPYLLLRLPSRVRGLALPHVELIDMKVQNRLRNGVHLISKRLEVLLRHTLESKQQAILLLNRRGYSNFVHCPSCQHVVQCRFCDTTMTYHRSADQHVGSAAHDRSVHTGELHCHYCLAVNLLPEKCPDCGKKLSLFGLGTQRVEEELAKKFPGLSYARVDSDSMRGSRAYETVLRRFGKGELQVMLGTQMIAKGLDYPNVTLVGVISGDTALALPDFRAAERTFQLLTQVAGRAGRGDQPGRVVVQTFLPDDPAIQAAIRQDYQAFVAGELPHRREVGLPPFARMVRIIIRDQEPEPLHERAEALAAEFAEAIAREAVDRVRVKGPMPCAISRIAGYHRQQIVLNSPSAAALQRVLAVMRQQGGFARGDRIAIDVDPVSLL
jgi:primosomal protein N' (replication factor Y) (superfamily II helicase)